MLHRAAPLGAPPSFASLAQVSQRVCAHFVINGDLYVEQRRCEQPSALRV